MSAALGLLARAPSRLACFQPFEQTKGIFWMNLQMPCNKKATNEPQGLRLMSNNEAGTRTNSYKPNKVTMRASVRDGPDTVRSMCHCGAPARMRARTNNGFARD